MVDGTECIVTSFGRYEFDCTVQKKAAISDLNVPHIGQHGLTRNFINKTSGINYDNVDKEKSELKLGIDLETEHNLGDNLASVYKSWFYPPHTGRYRFYMICDDYCQMKIAKCPGTISPLTTMLDLKKWTKWDSFWSNEN